MIDLKLVQKQPEVLAKALADRLSLKLPSLPETKK